MGSKLAKFVPTSHSLMANMQEGSFVILVGKNCVFLCTSTVQLLFQKLFNQIKFSSQPTTVLLGNFSTSGDNPVNLPSTSNEPAVVDQKIANSSRSDQFSFLADLRAPTIWQSSVLYHRPWVEQQKYCLVHRFLCSSH